MIFGFLCWNRFNDTVSVFCEINYGKHNPKGGGDDDVRIMTQLTDMVLFRKSWPCNNKVISFKIM